MLILTFEYLQECGQWESERLSYHPAQVNRLDGDLVIMMDAPEIYRNVHLTKLGS